MTAQTTTPARTRFHKVAGAFLQAGDRVAVWWHPPGLRIVAIEPYRGTLSGIWPMGAQIATFSDGMQMTIDNAEAYEVTTR